MVSFLFFFLQINSIVTLQESQHIERAVHMRKCDHFSGIGLIANIVLETACGCGVDETIFSSKLACGNFIVHFLVLVERSINSYFFFFQFKLRNLKTLKMKNI